MPLEDQIETLTDVVREGFAKLLAAGLGRPVVVDTPAPEVEQTKPNGADKPKGPTFEQVTAIAQKLASERGSAVAVKLINKHGAPRLAQLAEDKYGAFVTSAEILLSEEKPEL